MVSKKEAAIEEFRTILRVAAAEGGVAVLVFLRKLFEHSLVKGADGEYLSRAAFESGLTSLREVRGKLTRASLNEVFDECDDGGRGKVTLDEISTLCQLYNPFYIIPGITTVSHIGNLLSRGDTNDFSLQVTQRNLMK